MYGRSQIRPVINTQTFYPTPTSGAVSIDLRTGIKQTIDFNRLLKKIGPLFCHRVFRKKKSNLSGYRPPIGSHIGGTGQRSTDGIHRFEHIYITCQQEKGFYIFTLLIRQFFITSQIILYPLRINRTVGDRMNARKTIHPGHIIRHRRSNHLLIKLISSRFFRPFHKRIFRTFQFLGIFQYPTFHMIQI